MVKQLLYELIEYAVKGISKELNCKLTTLRNVSGRST